METYDDDLSKFETNGPPPLPATNEQSTVEHDGAQMKQVSRKWSG